MGDLIARVQAALTDELRRAPWRGSPNPMAGHCYVASEVLFSMTGGQAGPFRPQVIRHEGATHWYLKHQDGTIVDPTASQFLTPVPYEQGRGCGFLTRLPSRRARVVLDRIGA